MPILRGLNENRVVVISASLLQKRKEVAGMDIYETISLMIMFSMFLISFLSLVITIIKLNERKK